MTPKLLPPALVQRDADYVQQFQDLASLNLQVRALGPSKERLVLKAILERGVGNHAASLEAATDAVALDADLAEAHYQVGLALLAIALRKAGDVPSGPTERAAPDDSILDLGRKAVEAFREAARLDKDAECADLVEALSELVSGSEDELTAALRASLHASP